MNELDRERMKKLLRQSLPPVKSDAGPERDLWPDVLRRMDARDATPTLSGWAWFDGALAVGLVALAVLFPASVPLFLYYL